MPDSLRLVFAGTPEFAARHLESLLANDLAPVAVFTQPDRPAGRGRKLQASAVKQVANSTGIDVLQPANFKCHENQQLLHDLQPDLLIVVAYGLILPQAILDIPRLGCINVHASLLPKWRGAAPIQRAIEAGDTHSGVTIMQMDIGLDTGDMLQKAECPINDNETSQSLHDKLAQLGAEVLPKAVLQLAAGELVAETQDDSQATYAHKMSKAEGIINWQNDAITIDRKMRAFTPWPGSQCHLDDQLLKCQGTTTTTNNNDSSLPGTIIDITEQGLLVQTSAGQIVLTHLQFPGKRMSAVSDLLNAYSDKLAIGNQFT